MGDQATDRPAPDATGTLAKTPLLHLLIYAFEKKLAGTMDIVAPDQRVASLLFVGGEPAKAHVSEPVSYLGQILVELGHMTSDTLDRTLAELEDLRSVGERPLCGEFLRVKAQLDPASVEAGLREQIVRRLCYVAAMPPETTFKYYDGLDALRDIGVGSPRGIDPLPMLWTLLGETAPRAHIDAALARVGGAAIRLAKTADPVRLGLGATERAAIDLLGVRPLTVEEFPRVSGLADNDARLLAYLLLMTKQVDVIRTPRPSTPPPGSWPPKASSPPRASIRPTPVPVPFSSRSVASDPPPSAPIVPSQPPARLPPELSERWTAIVERARTIDRADYFVMLDLARDSTPREAQASFLALAMKWHPDRLPLELFPLRQACSRVFARLSEAHATLIDPERRAKYMRLLAEGSGTPEMQEAIAKVVEATEDFKKAEVCFRRNDFAQAEHLCRRALAGDATQPDYHAMLAWLISLKPENQSREKTIESIRMLDKALAISEQCERAYFWRGLLYKRIGKIEAAYRDFHEAVDLNPNNIDAVREMRLHNMRAGGRSSSNRVAAVTSRSSSTSLRKPSMQDEKSGPFWRLFKK
jgi:tetratricopeptide (TPR) repeat protein